MFEDEMTEDHVARTEAEYRQVTRQEIREQNIADDDCRRRSMIAEVVATAHVILGKRSFQ